MMASITRLGSLVRFDTQAAASTPTCPRVRIRPTPSRTSRCALKLDNFGPHPLAAWLRSVDRGSKRRSGGQLRSSHAGGSPSAVVTSCLTAASLRFGLVCVLAVLAATIALA